MIAYTATISWICLQQVGWPCRCLLLRLPWFQVTCGPLSIRKLSIDRKHRIDSGHGRLRRAASDLALVVSFSIIMGYSQNGTSENTYTVRYPLLCFACLSFFVQRWPYVVDRILKSLLVYLNVVFLFDWELGLEASYSVLSLFSCHLLWCVCVCVWRWGGGGCLQRQLKPLCLSVIRSSSTVDSIPLKKFQCSAVCFAQLF